jgi:3-hydroxyisobutyrate dehydrogenase
MSNHIAFIGVGNMGNPMAQQLVKAGQNVKVFDVSPDVIEIAKQSGLNVISSMEELLQGATTVISMLPEGKHVRSLYLGDNGILKKIPKDCLIIDCSTIDIETSLALR